MKIWLQYFLVLVVAICVSAVVDRQLLDRRLQRRNRNKDQISAVVDRQLLDRRLERNRDRIGSHQQNIDDRGQHHQQTHGSSGHHHQQTNGQTNGPYGRRGRFRARGRQHVSEPEHREFHHRRFEQPHATGLLHSSRWVDMLPRWLADLMSNLKDHDNRPSYAVTFDGLSNIEWWKGPNVCVEKEESEETLVPKDQEGEEDLMPHDVQTSSICDQSETTYKCTSTVRFFGKEKKYTVTYQCCHGYSRVEGETGCPQELNLKDISTTTNELGATEFMNAIKTLGIVTDEDLQDKEYTFLAPSNEAMKDFIPTMTGPITNPNLILVLPEANDVAQGAVQRLAAHVLTGLKRTSDFEDEEIVDSLFPGAGVRINFYRTHATKMVTANCVPLNVTDRLATNGVIHTMNNLMSPVYDSIMDIISKNPDLSVFKSIIDRVGLTPELRKMEGQYTLFAPSDSAFKKFPEATSVKMMEGTSCVESIVKNHLLPNVICSSIMQGRAKTRNSLNHYIHLLRENSGKVFANGAELIVTDIMAANGVIHIIDDVLIPDEALNLVEVAEQKNATEFLSLLKTIPDVLKVLQTGSNMTLFVPTNEAIQSLSLHQRNLLLNDENWRREVIKYHILESEKTFNQLIPNHKYRTLNAHNEITIKAYSSNPIFYASINKVAQCARLAHTRKDIEACNGIIHMTDKVLLPPAGDIIDALSKDHRSRFSRFLDLLKMTDLFGDLQTNEFTLFAPTNEAFDYVEESKLEDMLIDPEKLKGFLKSHIIRGTICSSGLKMPHSKWVKPGQISLQGSLITLADHNGDVLLDNGVKIQEYDLTATNGLIHAIDRFLPTPLEVFVDGKPPQRPRRLHGLIIDAIGDHWDIVKGTLRNMTLIRRFV